MHDFIIVCIGHLENISSLSYADLPNVDMLHYIIFKKVTRINIINLIRNIYKNWGAVKLVEIGRGFSKF